MVQNYNQQPPYNPPPRESSGMGVVLGVLLAVVIAVGAYFFMQNRNMENAGLEPAAGNTTINVETPAPDASAAPDASDTTTGSGTTAPAPNVDPIPQQ